MKKTLKKTMTFLFVGALLALMGSAAMAAPDTDDQLVGITISEIIDVGTTGTADFTISAPAEGSGLSPVVSAAETTSVEYTSTVGAAETRSVDVSVLLNAIPAGLTLNVEATALGASHGGDDGDLVADGIDLTSAASSVDSIITGIGSGHSGSPGATLTWTLSITTLADVVVQGATDATVTLTLTDAA